MGEQPESDKPLVQAHEVSKVFPVRPGLRGASEQRSFVRAVDRVSLDIGQSEIVGLVGESGCGKTTLGRLMICLESPTAGTVFFDDVDIGRLRGRKLRDQRRRMQIIFQDPASSLNPRYTVRDTLTEAIRVHRKRVPIRELNARLAAMLSMVGLTASDLDRYPHEFSGGQRQRVSIARALAVEPRFIVADEPISSLDLANQAQIIRLISDLREELNVSFLLITHDLDVVKHLCSRVAVMYLGRVIEIAPTEDLFRQPRHPYTRALMAANLSPDPDEQTRPHILQGDPPSPLDPPAGCHFHPRCPHAEIQCSLIQPPSREATDGHIIMCHYDL